MFNLFNAKKIEKEIALPFRVVLEYSEDGYFVATCPQLPGCTARGRTKSEALRNISEAARHHLDDSSQSGFELVWADPFNPTLNALTAFYGRLIAGTNRDSAVESTTGDFGSWGVHAMSRLGVNPLGAAAELGSNGNGGNGHAPGAGVEDPELVDYSPQVYCLSAFVPAGVARIFAGTSANGAIYESGDGMSWKLSYATGEARVHALAPFKGRLYAATSPAGKLFCYTGAHWSLAHLSPESAITALSEFGGELYMGTYPNGHIYASGDGLRWRLAFDSGQTFVRSFCEFKGHLYAATSKARGGMVLRSRDGLRWERVFEAKDPNFYCLKAFHKSLWLGTGNHGRLFRSEDGLNFKLAAALEDEGIRDMESFEGRLYLATEGLGRIYRSRFADTLPPEILDIRVAEVTSQSAVLHWRTDRPSDSRVQYGLSPDYGSTLQVAEAVTEHKVALSDLKSLECYHFKVFSQAPDHSDAAFSQDLTFSTAGAETARIQSSSHPDPNRWYSRKSAVASWSAPEGVVRFHYCVDREANTLPIPGRPGVESTRDRGADLGDLEDGETWLHLLCEDRAGNLGSEAEHFLFKTDTRALPPKLSSPSHPREESWSMRPLAQLNWEAPEDFSGIAGYHVLLDRRPDSLPGPDNGIWTEAPSFSAELPEDGEWYVHVASTDRAGNHGATASHYRLRLDRRADPPKVESSSHPDPQVWVNSSNVELQWSSPADLSGIAGYYTLFDQKPDSIPTAHTGTFTLAMEARFTGKEEGVWYFHIVSTDQAGNVGTVATHFPVRIDTWARPPRLSSSTHPLGAWSSSSRALVEIEPAEDLSGQVGWYWILDRERSTLPMAGKGTYTTERTLEFNSLADGQWILHVVSKDRAGNVGTEAAHFSLRIDTEAKPPILISTSHPDPEEWSRQSAVEMAWDAPEDLSGIAWYYYAFDREPDTVPTAHSGVRTSENRARVEAKEDGDWYFHVVSQDRAGNLGRQAGHYKVRIDTQALPPRLQCPTHPDRAAWSNHTRPRFEWSEPDDASGIAGYHYCFDRNPDTVPTPSGGLYTTERQVVIDRGLDEDGTWYFHVASRDRAGNVGVVAAHYSINLDTTALPPRISSVTHPDKHAWSSNPNPSFHWEEPEDPSGIAGYYYVLNHSQTTVPSENNGTWTEEPRASFAGLADGVWTLHVASRDRCGNSGATASHYSVRIDTQALPPFLSSPTHPDGNWSRNASPTFSWTPPQDLSGIAGYYTLLDREPSTVPNKETGQFTTASLSSFSRLEDGIWIFHVVSVDQAGNVGNRAAHYSVHLDTSAAPPKVASTTHPNPDKWQRSSAPHFTWTPPTDPSGVAGYYYAVDQAPDTVPGPQSKWCTETQLSLPEYADGEWYFHLATKDGAGNLSTEAAHFRFRIDSSAPKPRLHSRTHPSQEEYFNAVKPSFEWEDGEDLSGIVSHGWIFDQQDLTPVLQTNSSFTPGASVTLPPQKDGIWYFHLAAKDAAGNLSETVHYKVCIETQPPLSRLEPLPAVTLELAFEVRWQGEDKISGVASFDVQVRSGERGDWKDWQTASTVRSAVFTATDGGVYEFRVRARDKAGNAEAWPEGPYAKVAVDLSPPEPVEALNAKPGPDGSVILAWAPSQDRISGISHYEVHRSIRPGELGVKISQEKVWKTEFTDPGKGLVDGSLHYYTVVPVDKAGNRRPEGNAQASCLCDRSALPPLLHSPTHPVTLEWYNLRDARLRWDAPQDSSGVEGYYWSLDQSLSTVPGPKSGQWTDAGEIEVRNLKDGTWYVHVSTKDLAGNLSAEAAHYQLNIDTTPPPAPQLRSPSHPNPEAWSTLNDASFSWNVPPDPAKIAGYYHLLDQKAGTVPGPGLGTWTQSNSASFEGLEDGAWYFHVLAKDSAGNLGVQAGHCRVQVARTPPPPSVSSPTHPAGASSPLRDAQFQWKPPSYTEAITAFHYCLDQAPDTVPGKGDPRTAEGQASFSSLSDGEWYFHAVSVDSTGRFGKAASHCRIQVRSAGTLQGQVTKPNGILPAEGVGIEAFLKGKSVGRQATNKEGRFKFENLELGEYLVKMDAPGLPPQLLDGVKVGQAQVPLSLSLEICALAGGDGKKEVRFYVLARESGQLALKIYRESGTVVSELSAPTPRPAYHKVVWDAANAEAGVYLYQATLSSSSGKVFKYPIRKVQLA